MNLLKRAALNVLIGIGVLALALPVVTTEGALHIRNRPQPPASAADDIAPQTGATWEPAEVAAADGIRLRGWLFHPAQPNGGAVVLLHGVGDTRLGMLGHAEYMLRGGFTVLSPDARGHGSSGGDLITYGIKEASDVHVWAGWLLRQSGVQRIYGLGESMGAATLLESLPGEPRFRAVVAEGSFSTFEDIAYYRLWQIASLGHLEAWPIVRLGFGYARLRYGVDLWKASPEAAIQTTKVPILLIHGTADVNIPPEQSRELHARNRAGSTLWEVPGATHVEGLYAAPDEFPRRVLAWFETHQGLGGRLPQ